MNKLNKHKTYGKNKSAFFSLKAKSSKEEDDEFELETSERFCGYFLEQRAATRLVVPIDTAFKSPSYYRMVCNKIEELTENDVVEFQINSPGGDLTGLVALLHAVRMTDAETVATIIGDCYSAASLLALSCDVVSVGSLANMLCHSASFGSRGKATDVRHHVNHLTDYAESIFRECYEHFLSEEEIEDVLAGKELYLNFDEINERLQRKYSILQEMHDSMQEGCCGDPEGCDDICECKFAKDE